jgi:hypothetical protein
MMWVAFVHASGSSSRTHNALNTACDESRLAPTAL